MQIVIIGAGEVGFHAAKALSEGSHDITAVDIVPEKCSRLSENLDVIVVEGNGAVLIPVEANDQITVINTEGGQRCEIVATGVGGLIDASVIGTTANGTADGLRELLTSSEYS